MSESRRDRRWILNIWVVIAAVSMILFICSYYQYRGESQITMSEKVILVLTAVASLFSLLVTVLSQIHYYQRRFKTMDEIKSGVINGNERLIDRLDLEEKSLATEHKDIRDIARDIRFYQEQELELQKSIWDTVQDTGMLKDGIEKICMQNAQLKTEMEGLKQEMNKLQEGNKKLVKQMQRQQYYSQDLEME